MFSFYGCFTILLVSVFFSFIVFFVYLVSVFSFASFVFAVQKNDHAVKQSHKTTSCRSIVLA